MTIQTYSYLDSGRALFSLFSNCSEFSSKSRRYFNHHLFRFKLKNEGNNKNQKSRYCITDPDGKVTTTQLKNCLKNSGCPFDNGKLFLSVSRYEKLLKIEYLLQCFQINSHSQSQSSNTIHWYVQNIATRHRHTMTIQAILWII